MVVRMRRNRSETAKRRSHHALKGARGAACECGALRVPHRACQACGKYRGRVIVDTVARAKRTVRRTGRKEKSLRESGMSTSAKKASERGGEDAKAA